jgi:hypothetical protein
MIQSIEDIQQFISEHFVNYVINETEYELNYQRIQKNDGFMSEYFDPSWSLLIIILTLPQRRELTKMLIETLYEKYGFLQEHIISYLKQQIMKWVREAHYRELYYRQSNTEDYPDDEDDDFDEVFDEEFQFYSLINETNQKEILTTYNLAFIHYCLRDSLILIKNECDNICKKRIEVLNERAKYTILTLRKKTTICDDVILHISQYIHKNSYTTISNLE